MGTDPHKPHLDKRDWRGAHDAAALAAGPGERPGVPSRIEAARERMRRKGLL